MSSRSNNLCCGPSSAISIDIGHYDDGTFRSQLVRNGVP
jgi:hypothetical protein